MFLGWLRFRPAGCRPAAWNTWRGGGGGRSRGRRGGHVQPQPAGWRPSLASGQMPLGFFVSCSWEWGRASWKLRSAPAPQRGQSRLQTPQPTSTGAALSDPGLSGAWSSSAYLGASRPGPSVPRRWLSVPQPPQLPFPETPWSGVPGSGPWEITRARTRPSLTCFFSPKPLDDTPARFDLEGLLSLRVRPLTVLCF